jgi:N-acetylmuramoyl-L-alanine amidase
MKVCIDPGHQAEADILLEQMAPGSSVFKQRTSCGTVGTRTGIEEHEITLRVARLMETALLERNCEVVLTRRVESVHLSNIQRAILANQSGATFCVKIHCNGVRPVLKRFGWLKRGSLTIIPADGGSTRSIYQASVKIANVLHGRMLKATSFPDLGIRARGDLTGFNWSTIPVFLLELGYLTNRTDESFLVDSTFQRRLSVALAEGVVEAFGQLAEVSLTSSPAD